MNRIKQRNYSYEIWLNVSSICLHPWHVKFYSSGLCRAFKGISSDIKYKYLKRDKV